LSAPCRRLYVLSSSFTRLTYCQKRLSVEKCGHGGSTRLRCRQPGSRRSARPRLATERLYRHDQPEIVEHVVPRRSVRRAVAVRTQHPAIPAVSGRLFDGAAAPLVAATAEPPGDAGDTTRLGRGADRRLGRKTTHGPRPREGPEPREQKEEDHAPSRHAEQANGKTLRTACSPGTFRSGAPFSRRGRSFSPGGPGHRTRPRRGGRGPGPRPSVWYPRHAPSSPPWQRCRSRSWG